MKRPIAWHKEALAIRRRMIADEQARIDRIAHTQLERIAFADALEAQIARAEKEGLDGFDAERFNKRRGK